MLKMMAYDKYNQLVLRHPFHDAQGFPCNRRVRLKSVFFTFLLIHVLCRSFFPRQTDSNCQSNSTADLTNHLNTLLISSGPGFVLSLCPSQQYLIEAPLLFAAPNQEISTAGYPTDDTRAMLVVNGPVANGVGHTSAVDGTCPNCSGVKLRNIQVSAPRDPVDRQLFLFVFSDQRHSRRRSTNVWWCQHRIWWCQL